MKGTIHKYVLKLKKMMMMMETMKGLDVAGMMTDESVTDHVEPDMNQIIRV